MSVGGDVVASLKRKLFAWCRDVGLESQVAATTPPQRAKKKSPARGKATAKKKTVAKKKAADERDARPEAAATLGGGLPGALSEVGG